MKPDSRSKVLITGLSGFTGKHLSNYLEKNGFHVIGLESDLCDKESLRFEVGTYQLDYVVHLAGISYAADQRVSQIYDTNVQGTLNLLDALIATDQAIKKVILASSATVYGNLGQSVLSESVCPKPVSHYGCSKLAMECMSSAYYEKLPVLITRPFNYTGVGHSESFLIPKIVKAFQSKQNSIELGNLDVSREFNDVRDICGIYHDLLLCDRSSDVVNLCSNKAISLMDIIDYMNDISGSKMDVVVNPAFVRVNEIKELSGDVSKLNRLVEPVFNYNIKDTLRWMYESSL